MTRRTAENHPSSARMRTYRILMTTATCLVLGALALLAIPSPRSVDEEQEGSLAIESREKERRVSPRERLEGRQASTVMPEEPTPDPRTNTNVQSPEDEAALEDSVRVLVERVRGTRDGLDRLDPRETPETYARRALEAIVPSLLEIDRRHPEVFQEVLSKAFDEAQRSSGTRASSNESAAIATLRNLASAQSQLQASGAIDQDRDGHGEFGFFSELSGGRTLRGEETVLSPPVLSAAFRNVQNGIVKRSGYAFRVFLPDAQGAGVAEGDGDAGGFATAGAADHGETTWCAYAWPLDASSGSKRVFFINQQGDVLACTNQVANGGAGYFGDAGPPAYAAFQVEGLLGLITGKVAANAQGWDGETWIVVG